MIPFLLSYIGYIVVAFVVICLALAAVFVVEQQTNAIVERFGKFHAIRTPGRNSRFLSLTGWCSASASVSASLT